MPDHLPWLADLLECLALGIEPLFVPSGDRHARAWNPMHSVHHIEPLYTSSCRKGLHSVRWHHDSWMPLGASEATLAPDSTIPTCTWSEVNQRWTEVCVAAYLSQVPRKYGHTTKPRMTFHQTRRAKLMLNSQPANQRMPPVAPAPPPLPPCECFSWCSSVILSSYTRCELALLLPL